MTLQKEDYPLFVYGTLKPGEENDFLLKPLGGRWQAAKMQGVVYPQGYQHIVGYPVMVLEQTDHWVDGLLFSAKQLSDYWPKLDAFEEGYRRVLHQVSMDNGQRLRAYVYAY